MRTNQNIQLTTLNVNVVVRDFAPWMQQSIENTQHPKSQFCDLSFLDDESRRLPALLGFPSSWGVLTPNFQSRLSLINIPDLRMGAVAKESDVDRSRVDRASLFFVS